MQVVPVNIVDNAIKHDTTQSSMPKLNNGEAIVAQVVSKNGDIVTLQRPDGTKMTAQVMSDVLLSLGDSINLTVTGNNGKQFMMQLISVEAGTVELGSQNQLGGGLVTLQTQVALIFDNMGLKPNAQMMNTVMDTLSQNEGLSPRVAVFMALNGIEPTAQNINTINSMLESPIGSKLSQMVNQLVSQNENLDSNIKLVDTSLNSQQQASAKVSQQQAGSVANNTAATQGNIETLANTANNQNQAQIAQTAANNQGQVQTAQTTQTTANNQSQVQVSQTTQTAPNNQDQVQNMQPAPNDQAPAQMMQTTQGTQTNQSQQSQVVDSAQLQSSAGELVEGNVFGEIINQPQQLQTSIKMDMFSQEFLSLLNSNHSDAKESQILAKVLSLFTKLGVEGKDSSKISESKEDSQLRLNELKDLIKSSDIKNKEAYLTKSDSILAEKSLASDINRFQYMQIPIGNQENAQTAEVFVYKRKKKDKELDAQDISILVGLDTINLGRIETLIKVDKKNISLKISEENSNAANLIKKHAHSLSESLQEVGFHLFNIKVEKLYEKTTIVNAEETLMWSEMNATGRVDYQI